jgi:hypothetical protein
MLTSKFRPNVALRKLNRNFTLTQLFQHKVKATLEYNLILTIGGLY